MDIHKRIKTLCKERGMLFKELAKRVGITEVGLRKSLKGKPSLTTLEKVASALNVETWELLTNNVITNNAKPIFVCPHCGTRLHITLEEDSKGKEAAATNKGKETAATDSTENTSEEWDSVLKEGLANF
nr:MAG TPA: helix-turn-helix domain protein [Caudoviricetes sp.]